MIKPLLDYQQKEKEKIDLVNVVESGKIKRDIDEANRMLDSMKKVVLNLEDEAKHTASNIDAIKKNMSELLVRTDEISSKDHDKSSEDELGSAIAYTSAVNTKVVGYEAQLNELIKKINNANQAFEDAKLKIMRAQKVIQTLTPEYEKQKKDIAGKANEIEEELKKLGNAVDKKLLEIYKKARSTEKGGKPVVVKLNSDRCGGCHFELPLSLTHKIDVDGYIVCEECNKIIYK
ncbi:MAG: hypothetical protein FWE45_03805 [Firmicutes bacterium]|nr:hypothetical protein [Bacillota bacterium]